MKICFLGAGAFGTALADVAKENGHIVNFYDPIKFPNISINDATKDAELAIYVAPSDKHTDILPHLPADLPIICASKGFLSTKPFDKFNDFTALGGAGFAAEIEQATSASQTSITFTTSSEPAENIFSTENIHIEYTADTLGIMLCGAMKNIYAIGAGLFGDDDNSAPMSYLESAAREIQEILSANGAREDTLQLSCGVPDLLISCTKNSRNFRFGRAIKSNSAPEDATIEGLAIIKSLDNYPEFVVPDSAAIFNKIVKEVKSYAA